MTQGSASGAGERKTDAAGENNRSSTSHKRKSDSGKRRQGREMALQMLFQWESCTTHPSEVLRAFDLSLYRSETANASLGADQSSKAHGRQETDDQESGLDPLDPELDDIDRRREIARRANVERQINVELGLKARSKAYQFARSLLLGVVEHREAIDEAIVSRADNWRIERMPRVDRNILRTALFEAMFLKELPKAVIIDEAIELAKKFGGENSGAFVNGLLDGVLG